MFEISLKFGGKRKYCRRRSQPNVQLFIILSVGYSTLLSIMNNSVKIKFNFFSVRKYFLHINLIIPGKFLSINDVVSKLVVKCS